MKKVIFVLFSLFLLACSDNKGAEEEGKNKKENKNQKDTIAQSSPVKSIQIGSQVWMVEDLSITDYSNGDPIPEHQDSSTWASTTDGAYTKLDNGSMVYNWFAINDARGICPKGWRVPSTEDWQILVDEIGVDSTAGGMLKDSSAWPKENVVVTENYGFNAQPIGYRLANGKVLNEDKIVIYWTSNTGDEIANAKDRFIISNSKLLGQSEYGKNSGFSCRCLKD